MTTDQASNPADYAVGYGKPPKAGQFAKGKSGNPRGRPRAKPKLTLSRAVEEPTADIILQEAYRKVKVRIGDKQVEMTTMEAIARTVAIAAMKGDRHAQRAMTAAVQKAESDKAATQVKHFESVVDYKKSWEAPFARADAAGIPRPDPVPHPDDYIIDVRNGVVRLEGPLTDEEKVEWDKGLRLRDSWQKRINELTREMKSEPGNKGLRETRLQIQGKFDALTETMPKRYQKTLKNRLWDD